MFSLHSRQHKTHLQITCVLIYIVENTNNIISMHYKSNCMVLYMYVHI